MLSGVQNFLDALGSAFGGASSGNTAASVNAKAVEVAEAALNAEAAAIALQSQQANGGSSTGVIAFVDTLGDDGDATIDDAQHPFGQALLRQQQSCVGQ